MDKIFFLVLCLFWGQINAFSQERYKNFMPVDVPDSISVMLENEYGRDCVNAGKNVWNIISPECKVLTDGIYSFKGQGPHFHRKIFIYHKKNIYILKNFGLYSPQGIIEDFAKCINLLKLPRELIVKYTIAIGKYLEEEQIDYEYLIESQKQVP